MYYASLKEYIAKNYGPLTIYRCLILDFLYCINQLTNNSQYTESQITYLSHIFFEEDLSNKITSSIFGQSDFYYPSSITTLCLIPSKFNFSTIINNPDLLKGRPFYLYEKVPSGYINNPYYQGLYKLNRYIETIPRPLLLIPFTDLNVYDKLYTPDETLTGIDIFEIESKYPSEDPILLQLLVKVYLEGSSYNTILNLIKQNLTTSDPLEFIQTGLQSKLSKLFLLDILLIGLSQYQNGQPSDPSVSEYEDTIEYLISDLTDIHLMLGDDILQETQQLDISESARLAFLNIYWLRIGAEIAKLTKT